MSLLSPISSVSPTARASCNARISRISPPRTVISYAASFVFLSLGIALLSALSLAFASNASAAEATAKVKFINVASYFDMPFSQHARNDVFATLTAHFEKLAAKLPAGQTMNIEVSDLSLAGRIEPSLISLGNDVRILRGGTDWPSLKFSYTIAADGKVIKEGKADIADLNYLRGFNRYSSSESLRYEKKLLDDWFRKDLAAAGL